MLPLESQALAPKRRNKEEAEAAAAAAAEGGGKEREGRGTLRFILDSGYNNTQLQEVFAAALFFFFSFFALPSHEARKNNIIRNEFIFFPIK